MQKSMSLKYEPASEPLHISVKKLSLNWRGQHCCFITAGERGGNNLNGFKDFHTENGSSQGLNLISKHL